MHMRQENHEYICLPIIANPPRFLYNFLQQKVGLFIFRLVNFLGCYKRFPYGIRCIFQTVSSNFYAESAILFRVVLSVFHVESVTFFCWF